MSTTPVRTKLQSVSPRSSRNAMASPPSVQTQKFASRRRAGPGGLPAGPSLLRVTGAATRRLVAPSSAAPPLRVSVSRGEGPPVPPGALSAHFGLTTLAREGQYGLGDGAEGRDALGPAHLDRRP